MWEVLNPPARKIADNNKVDKTPPTDIVDIFWRNKYDSEDPNCRERDFLRLTSVG